MYLDKYRNHIENNNYTHIPIQIMGGFEGSDMKRALSLEFF